jgi:hypothetical protein
MATARATFSGHIRRLNALQYIVSGVLERECDAPPLATTIELSSRQYEDRKRGRCSRTDQEAAQRPHPDPAANGAIAPEE